MNKIESKIRGIFTGIFLGDAIGAVCESRTADEIKEKFGRITGFVDPMKPGREMGIPTDDWQLTRAVALAMLKEDPYNIKNYIKSHIDAYKKTTAGWGRSTKQSVKRMSKGKTWWQSGAGSIGGGNGISMKIAPIAIFLSSPKSDSKKVFDLVKKISLMTHRNTLGLSSGFAQVEAVYYCFMHTPDSFDEQEFITKLYNLTAYIELHKWGNVKVWEEKLHEKILELRWFDDLDMDWITEAFGGGSCYAINSLPFSYAFFLKNTGFQGMLNTINAGGDTDTNGSIVGSLSGALHGVTAFPKRIRDQIKPKYQEEIDNLSRSFYEKFFK